MREDQQLIAMRRGETSKEVEFLIAEHLDDLELSVCKKIYLTLGKSLTGEEAIRLVTELASYHAMRKKLKLDQDKGIQAGHDLTME